MPASTRFSSDTIFAIASSGAGRAAIAVLRNFLFSEPRRRQTMTRYQPGVAPIAADNGNPGKPYLGIVRSP
jgi:hypothetical protein